MSSTLPVFYGLHGADHPWLRSRLRQAAACIVSATTLPSRACIHDFGFEIGGTVPADGGQHLPLAAASTSLSDELAVAHVLPERALMVIYYAAKWCFCGRVGQRDRQNVATVPSRLDGPIGASAWLRNSLGSTHLNTVRQGRTQLRQSGANLAAICVADRKVNSARHRNYVLRP